MFPGLNNRHRGRLFPSALQCTVVFILLISTTVLAFTPVRPLAIKTWQMQAPLYVRPSDGSNDFPSDLSSEQPVETTPDVTARRPGLIRRLFPQFPWSRLPNYLTFTRCLAIPIVMIIYYIPGYHLHTSFLFAAASFTDWLDGYLARRWEVSSSFGAFLDPVADKLMVSTALILLCGTFGPQVAIPTAIILAREIAVSALREWMAQRGQRDSVQVGMQGKIKTALTMVALTILLAVPRSDAFVGSFWSSLYHPGLLLLHLATAITVTSGSVYFRAAAPILLSSDES